MLPPVVARCVVIPAAVLMVTLTHLGCDGFSPCVHIGNEAPRSTAVRACQPVTIGLLYLIVFG